MQQLVRRFRARSAADKLVRKFGTEQPLQQELLSMEQLAQHARMLAGRHKLSTRPSADRLLPRLTQNEAVLTRAYQVIVAAAEKGREIPVIAEWLLDNFYLIENHIRNARQHLPKAYSQQLPRLQNGHYPGMPRVHEMALELISHSDARVDADSISRFVSAYQEVAPLKLGELWAIPIMVRLGLIENLRRIASRIAARHAEYEKAIHWADRLIQRAEKDPKKLVLIVAEMALSDVTISSAFVTEFTRRLQGQSGDQTFSLTWLEQQLPPGVTVKQLVQVENHRQAAEQVSISNSISSLRALEAVDWREFVETLSVVEQILRQDPADVYSDMDFATRDYYRHAVEDMARRGKIAESDLAVSAIKIAGEAAAGNGSRRREAHVGYYLAGPGLDAFMREIGLHLNWASIAARFIRHRALPLYLFTVFAVAAVVTATAMLYLPVRPISPWLHLLMAAVAFLAATQFSLEVVNRIAMRLVKPRRLPRMDYTQGIPADMTTLVTVPTMLTSSNGVDQLLEALEIRYLANRDDNLYFSLLTDFADAPEQVMPADAELLARAVSGIESLNSKYAPNDPAEGPFFLFHRERKWNVQENKWMGCERKRGKLSDLNGFLRGVLPDPFSVVIGNSAILCHVRFVITLDTDTLLPRDCAQQLVATLAHILNRPRYDVALGRITEGYGLLQPRISSELPTHPVSWFLKLFAGPAGIDPYTRTVSDIYQDLFAEGSFIGKGIYDVDAFEAALEGRFPDNRILSHDLIEGCYARSGLVSDVQLYENYPSRYAADISRRHRWIRGDWQIAAWIFPRPPAQNGSRVANNLSALSRWKILDNLRRSVTPVVVLLLLCLGWMTNAPGLWTAGLLGLLVFPFLISSLIDLVRKPDDLPFVMHAASEFRSVARQLGQCLFALTMLPYEAYIGLDAITRALTRVLFTRRNLLEWVTSGDAERKTSSSLGSSILRMWSGPAAAFLGLAIVYTHPLAYWIAVPFCTAWFMSSLVAWWASRELPDPSPQLTATQFRFLELRARRTWRFFEMFCGPDDNWLPVDNHQEHPVTATAHRTSPTNIGMSLLASLGAHDFGYISTTNLLDRTASTLATMQRLERFRGHFYNWYDTHSLEPLLPHYISTVDSGNLAGHLRILRQGLLGLAEHRNLCMVIRKGLRHTLQVAGETVNHPTLNDTAIPASRAHTLAVARQIQRISKLLEQPCHTLTQEKTALAELLTEAVALTAAGQLAGPELAWWCESFERQCRDFMENLNEYAPWIDQLPELDGEQGQESFNSVFALLNATDGQLTLREVASLDTEVRSLVEAEMAANNGGKQVAPVELPTALLEALVQGSTNARERLEEIQRLAEICEQMSNFECDFLYDVSRNLFTIGYNTAERRSDASFYDLLASEARLASFLAIADGHVPQKHWFSLGRQLTSAGGKPALLSWSGSMFEYLMPNLVMPAYQNTLLDETCKAVVERQIEYGRYRGVPWGISESGYSVVNAQLDYQYHAFGVPGLGLKRGLSKDLVIAPYAAMLALMVEPEKACANLQRMVAQGAEGEFGMYEAIDFTPSRVPRGQSSVLVRSYMAHHQGMSFLSLAYLLLDRPMQRRFAMDAEFRATELLLQERVPNARPFYPHTVEVESTRSGAPVEEQLSRTFTSPHSAYPAVQLLSNGQYSVAVTSAGGGYSRWKDLAVTRWREDATCDNWGQFCYIRDIDSGDFWSIAHQPVLQETRHYEAIFSHGRAEFRRTDKNIETHSEIVVSPEDDVELRRTTLTNRSRETRTIEITSYGEVVLAAQPSDETHPAFSNLFVQTEIIHERQAILCTRRRRAPDEHHPWMAHVLAVHGQSVGEASYETDRSRFIGRAHNSASPICMRRGATLSGSEGPVLDPIVAIRCTVTLRPDESAIADIVTGVAESRSAAISLVEKYHDQRLADRMIDLSWTHERVLFRQIPATQRDLQVYQQLAGAILYANPTHRATAATLSLNRRTQSGLWGYGISGDLPIVLLRVDDRAHLDLVGEAIQAHAYWDGMGLKTDLLIVNEDRSGYRQMLQDELLALVTASGQPVDRPAGIFVRRADQMPEEDRILLQTVARVILTGSGGSLARHGERRPRKEPLTAKLETIRGQRVQPVAQPLPYKRELAFDNGIGGFTPDGREYICTTDKRTRTPAPWSNVIANPYFGTVVTESGGGYTWRENSHEFRLTPWSNDPVSDGPGESLFIRDEETGSFWSPTPLPAAGNSPYVTRHGFGYTVFEHSDEGIATELWIYVSVDAPVKFFALKVRNHSGRTRRLSATCCVEWVLGELRRNSFLHVKTEIEPKSGALFAYNPYHSGMGDRVAFLNVSESFRSVTGDRAEFIGRNGSMKAPAAMGRTRLSDRTGAGLDPCGAIMVQFEMRDGEEREIVFTLGAGYDTHDAQSVTERFTGVAQAREALQQVWHHWNHALGAIHVETPDQQFNTLANGWLVYQTMSARMWGRTGFYQSGGAFGFRDQLQDAMALIHVEPARLRDHLLYCASNQFLEGDVQHWWHPPSGRGVRTHCSDDLLWLPLAVCRYVHSIGDTGVLDEQVGFLQAPLLSQDEESHYDLPISSGQSTSLYDHCVRAIEKGLASGEHGLPLIGGCDWNDGMNLVGHQGKGESVWLAFFLYDILQSFSGIAEARGDEAFAIRCRTEAARLKENVETHAWDGAWYRRAYYDNGDPMGSAANSECRIDSLSQSWAVLSGAGSQDRCKVAMESLNQHLVRRDASIILLLDPPFDKSEQEPGYIKGYVPGVRENGGQYTHAAIWATMAFAAAGDSDRAWELFRLINPLTHSSSPEKLATYRVEPYVVAADVYGAEPHVGRGGWTWYTGSAAWMYRLLIESFLGIRREVNTLRFEPRIPSEWNTLRIHYRYYETVYHITLTREGAGNNVVRVTAEGADQPSRSIDLINDQKEHFAEVFVG